MSRLALQRKKKKKIQIELKKKGEVSFQISSGIFPETGGSLRAYTFHVPFLLVYSVEMKAKLIDEGGFSRRLFNPQGIKEERKRL